MQAQQVQSVKAPQDNEVFLSQGPPFRIFLIFTQDRHARQQFV
jgi:hypothetical protein